MNIHPLNKIKLVGTVIAVAVIAMVGIVQMPDRANAGPNDNTHGWLWSDMPTLSDHEQNPTNIFGGRGLGYISVNSSDAGMSGSYVVNLDLTTGDFSGQGWSEFGGWLDFDPSGTPPLALGNIRYPAKLDGACLSNTAQTSCPVLGWAKFTAGGTVQSGGWDGWVSMQGTGPNYGVRYDKGMKKFTGHGWGDWVAGWIDFNNMSVDTIAPPVCIGVNGQPIVCPTLYLVCTDLTGNLVRYLATDPMPTQCRQAVCYDAVGVVHTYTIGTPMPSICTTPYSPDVGPDPIDPLDICPLIPGNQTRGQLPREYNGVWYGLAGGQCIPSVCSNPPYDDQFYATAPDGTSALPNGTCRKFADICKENPELCETVNGVIRPIYRED